MDDNRLSTNIIGDEVSSIEEQTSHVEIDAAYQQISSLPDFMSNSNKYALIMFDLETTGNSEQQIVQIGAWEMFTNSIYESLVKPGNFWTVLL